ncbi:DUF5683 domain-containing protein [Daejeonella oryzae]|uniref:DUF5683 domain-containing protein n=1 Tax=Daejeonella oryzae TaxID=1122943 RepID=UPI000422CD8C|nr:DUF5683 domain-containing protein [Daejeonella oryzae]
MNYKYLILAVIFFILGSTQVFAQQTDTVLKADTVKPLNKPAVKESETVVKDSARLALEKMPRKAAMRSAILPGLGQISNGRWWKVPLVYGGFVGIALVYNFNQTNYKIFLKEAQVRDFNTTAPDSLKLPGNPLYAGYSSTGIITIKDGYRRNRDLSILGGIAFYAINIIDAYIDAKFFRFDITDDLSLRVKPTLQRMPVNAQNAPLPGIKFTLSL